MNILLLFDHMVLVNCDIMYIMILEKYVFSRKKLKCNKNLDCLM